MILCNHTSGDCRDVSHCFQPVLDSNSCLAIVVSMIVLECNRGSYGYECNQTCGHCRDVSQCIPSNRTQVEIFSLTGCYFCYEGDLCKTRE